MSTKRKQIAFISAIAFILLSGVIAGAFILNSTLINPSPEQADRLNIASSAEEWNQSLPESSAASEKQSNQTKIPGYGVLHLKSNTSKANITLPNPKGNDCYFKYTLKIKDEVLYESDLVAPGKAIKEFALNKSLAKGEYKLTLEIAPYSLDNKASLVGANVNTRLVVS